MAQLSNITLPNGTTYNLKGSIYSVVGTQTASTGSWTGNLTSLDALYDGLTIAYYLPWAGNGNATLNLTLKNGTTGAINCYYNNTTRLTTHYAKGSVILLTYFSAGSISIDGTATTDNRWIAGQNYDSNSNNYDRILHNDNILAATAITAGYLICGTSAGYKNIGAGVAFDITYPILYASKAISANASAKTAYEAMPGINFSTSGTITSGAANKMLYLVGTLSGTTFTIASSGFLTTVAPTSANGKAYIPLGIMTATTTGFFASSKDIYMYLNGSFRAIGDASKDAIVNITRSGTTFTMTKVDGTTATFTQQDNNTTYSAGTGLSLSGTTFNHSNSITKQDTQAIYPIKIDAQGHISAYGSAVVPLTAASNLDASKLTGTVPSSVLPSYVDDVIEGYLYNSKFYKETTHTTEITAETGKIYVSKDTNKTYRWSGSAYIVISETLAIGTTASTAAAGNHKHTVTATGTVATSTATTENKTATVSAASSGTTTYTPAGTNSAPTFTGTAATISVSKSYTPAGSVSTPTISVKTAGSTTTVNSITAVGTLPSLTVTNQTVVTGTSVSDEVMSFITATNGSASGWSAGTLPTKGANTTVKTGDAAYQSSQPSFTGTAATITSTGSYTPAGSVSAPTFSGTAVRLVTGNIAVPKTYTSTFTGTSATTSVPA